MARGSVVVRDAVVADASALVAIWEDFSNVRERFSMAAATVEETSRAIVRVETDSAERLLVATLEGVPVGVAHLRRAPLSPIHDEDAVHVGNLHVLTNHRRRGVGTSLLSAATDWAEEKDTEHIVAAVAASARDSNRFLARLGMGQAAVVRASTVARLRARLSPVPVKAVPVTVRVARRERRRRARAAR